MPPRRLSPAWRLAAGLVLAGAILFQVYPTFASYFIADDYFWLRFAQGAPSLGRAALLPSPGGWTTPVSNLLFLSEFGLFGLRAGGYYAVGALLHLINALLVFDLAHQVTGRRALALGAALIFALHFVHYSDFGALVWIGAFVQVIVATFYLATFCLIVRYWRTGGRRFWWGALGAFVLALLSKESALSLPLLLTGWWALELAEQPGRDWRRALKDLWPFYAVWAVYLIYETAFQAAGVYLQQGQFKIGWHLLTNLAYFANLFLPNPASPPVRSFLAGSFPGWVLPAAEALTWGVRLGLLAAAVGLWWKGPPRLRRWLAWIVICHLPFLGFVSGLAGPNRYFYLSAVGLAVLLAEAASWLYARLAARFRRPVALGLAGVLLAGAFAFNLAPARVWQRQMRANSEVRLAVLHLVAQAAPQAVVLQGFPDRFADLPLALNVAQDLSEVTLAPEGAPAPAPGGRTLLIDYGGGQPVVIGP